MTGKSSGFADLNELKGRKMIATTTGFPVGLTRYSVVLPLDLLLIILFPHSGAIQLGVFNTFILNAYVILLWFQ
ncbi:MAG: hypothetical protein F7B59_02160 [Desulfurococcales archaeon]|nr:hypothetical protein [Desulfurococcales archaeon]